MLNWANRAPSILSCSPSPHGSEESVHAECLSETDGGHGVFNMRCFEAVHADIELRLLRVGKERPKQVAGWKGFPLTGYAGNPGYRSRPAGIRGLHLDC